MATSGGGGVADKMSMEKKKPGTDNRSEIQGDKKKLNIVTPVVKKLENPFEGVENIDASIFKKRKDQRHYVRVSYIRNVPDPDAYEATDEDLKLMRSLNEKASKIPKATPMTRAIFEKVIQSWEHDTAKGEIIPLERAQFLADSIVGSNMKEPMEELYNVRKFFLKPLFF